MSTRSYSDEEIQDLTDRVFLLSERLESGKMRIAKHLVDDFKRSFEAVRLTADGKVDPNTVDGRVRATGLALMAMRQREDAKKQASLVQIQEKYFAVLFSEFGTLYEYMIEAGVNPEQAGRAMSQDNDLVKSVTEGLPALVEYLKEFWDGVEDVAAYHLQDGQQLKAAFAGDLFPGYWENAVSTAGLYVDTIVLPCPIIRIAPLIGRLQGKELTALLLKHTFTAMSYRELATADVSPPIVLIVPTPTDVGAKNQIALVERTFPAMQKHAKYLFGRSFESLAHLKDFCSHLITIDQVEKELVGRDRFLISAEWDRDPRTQLKRAMEEQAPVWSGGLEPVAVNHVFNLFVGRMPQAMAAQEKALHFGGSPLISAEGSWLHYTWFLEYEGTPAIGDDRNRESMHVIRALVSESHNNLAWLGNVPPETVLQIRKQGLGEEIRSLLSRGVSDLIGINPSNYFRTADQVVENLDAAFLEHQKKILEAKRKKLKLYGIDVPACIAVGAVAVAAAYTVSPLVGAASGGLGHRWHSESKGH